MDAIAARRPDSGTASMAHFKVALFRGVYSFTTPGSTRPQMARSGPALLDHHDPRADRWPARSALAGRLRERQALPLPRGTMSARPYASGPTAR
jgi:hypothetical protein